MGTISSAPAIAKKSMASSVARNDSVTTHTSTASGSESEEEYSDFDDLESEDEVVKNDKDNVDERLRPEVALTDYRLTEVAVVPKNKSASRSVSTSDILRLQSATAASPNNNTKQQQSAGESSLSSGGGTGLDDEERSLSPPLANSTMMPQRGGGTQPRPPLKKRRAPQPPGGMGASVSRGKSATELSR